MEPPTSRRRFLATALSGATAWTAGCSSRPSVEGAETDAEPPQTADLPDEVRLETVVSGLEQPVGVAFATETDRRYLVEREGVVYAHDSDGLREEPFLDLRDAVVTGGERGLLGIALHPEFAENRRLFVRYSAPPRPGTPESHSHTFVLAEFEATPDGTRARRDSERTVLEIPQPRELHNAGDIAFGPEGALYIPVGDSANAQAAQDVATNRLGSILRVDVSERRYAVPSDNPLVEEWGIDEYYAWGFRNPWRLSFDGADLYVADVGQNSYEEVNLVEAGGNYGWPIKEGTHCFNADDCPDRTSEDVRGGEPLVDPIIEYPHDGGGVSGVSVIGGQVYRGSAVPALEGAYVFGDFQADGRLFAATRPGGDDGGLWPITVLEVAEGRTLQYALGFGRREGEVFVLGVGGDGGGLFRIADAA